MDHLGSLNGVGRVLARGAPIGEIEYSIDVWRERGGLKSANGQAHGDFDVLARIFRSGKVALELADNRGTLAFAITQLNDGGAVIAVSGPVPGF